MLQPKVGGGVEKQLIFRLSLKCGLIGDAWKNARDTVVLEKHIWSPSKCPKDVAERSSTPQLHQKQQGEREHLRKQE